MRKGMKHEILLGLSVLHFDFFNFEVNKYICWVFFCVCFSIVLNLKTEPFYEPP